eukprot:gene1327-1907_t
MACDVQHNASCRILCPAITYSKEEIGLWKKRVEQQYRGNMVLDNLPVAQEIKTTPLHPGVIMGYPLGVPK